MVTRGAEEVQFVHGAEQGGTHFWRFISHTLVDGRAGRVRELDGGAPSVFCLSLRTTSARTNIRACCRIFKGPHIFFYTVGI
jgi:hypothetical protein